MWGYNIITTNIRNSTTMSKQDKEKPIFGLCKLPIKFLLKASRQEVGELKAYVSELEDINKELQGQLQALKTDNNKLLELNQHYTESRCQMAEELEQLRENNERLLATLKRIKEIAVAAQEK